jgi:hypothetical protein
MQHNIISGKISVPEEKEQQRLHRQLGEFSQWLQKPKTANEIRKDKLKSVPTAMLPMVF